MTSYDEQRDAEVAEWNDALEGGDPVVIKATQSKILRAIHKRIGSEDRRDRRARRLLQEPWRSPSDDSFRR